MSFSTISKFIIRTPLLPAIDLVSDEKDLLTVFKNSIVRHALYIASPELMQELEKLESGQIKDNNKKMRISISLYKYYTRMCTRCTPFGMFAGISIGKLKEHTHISMANTHSLRARLDMDFLCNIFYIINQDELTYPDLRFFSNNSLYQVNKKWRYIEYGFTAKKVKFHNLINIDDNEILSQIISVTKKGASYKSLTQLVTSHKYSQLEATEYLNELIKNQILWSELYPSITGDLYQKHLINALYEIGAGKYSQLAIILQNWMNDSVKDIQLATEVLRKQSRLFGIDVKPNQLIQVDLLKIPRECVLSTDITEKIFQSINLLARLSPIQKQQYSYLSKFKSAFYERFEARFMPLMQVLDIDIGIGYKNALSIVGALQQVDTSNSVVNLTIRKFKQKLYSEALKADEKWITIDPKSIEELPKTEKPFCSTFSFIGQMSQSKDGNISLKFKSAGGSSAMNLFGRFGHLDPDFDVIAKEISEFETEANPNKVLAEIVHLPGSRVGNILIRPNFRAYEIPYLCHSTVSEDCQISLEELYIGIRQSKMILYSSRLNCEVLPRMATAHNFHMDSLPVYNFLCDLQTQDQNPGISWSWDELREEQFLPGIKFQDVVLSSPKWNIQTNLFSRENIASDKLRKTRSILAKLNIPRKIIVVQGDNELFIDLGLDIGVETFLSLCSKEKQLLIEEYFYNSDDYIDGYTSEIIVPVLNSAINRHDELKNPIRKHPIKSQFTPCSEWVYIKLFAGKKFSETLLVESIPSLITDIKRRSLIDKWFFIRYADPYHHLRLRFHLQNTYGRNELIEIVGRHLEPLLNEDVVWDLQLATYKPELERYGYETIEESESWFYHNSEFVLECLTLFKSASPTDQVLFCLTFINLLFDQWNFSQSERLMICSVQLAQFKLEFKVDHNEVLKKALNEEYRQINNKLRERLGGKSESDPLDLNLLGRYQQQTQFIILNIKEKGEIRKQYEIAASFIHMFINRLFASDQRFKEMTLYYFISKFYDPKNIYQGFPLKAAVECVSI